MTGNRTTELLPCPFCGGEASKRLFYGARYGVYCDECDARVGGLLNTEAEAIAAWNSRAERTCNLIEDGDLLHCSECGGAAEERLWAYWHYCPNCGAKVVDDELEH